MSYRGVRKQEHIKDGNEVGEGIRWDSDIFFSLVLATWRKRQELLCGAYFDPEKVLEEGSPERKAFYHDMAVIAGYLKEFCDAGIPILWRPFHESDGTWFWWGSKGPEVARELYLLMYDYYVNEWHLDNLLWVWNCRLPEGYPGDAYVDVVSVDIYLPEYKPTDYADAYGKLIKATSSDKVAALAEVGYMPDVDCLAQSHTPWAYYMTWSKEFCIGEQYNSKENLRRMYDSDYAVTE